MKNRLLYGLLALAVGSASHATHIQAVTFRVPAKWPEAAENFSPADIQLKGWLGERVLNNARNRLARVDLEPLLAGFRKKPGNHPWIGEHIGKWMHAAALAWANTGDDELRKKLEYAVAELVKAQEPDGYLGTYVPEKRFGLFQGADWDVWSHKYCLMGLLTYYQFTGHQPALEASRKAGDLLVKTFGPDKGSIPSAGTHVGMAATSVLEPMVLLYRHTGDERYLEFCRYLVKSWGEPNGPKILDSLLNTHQVNKTANAKAYEMLSNLVGLCELARVTGERQFIEAVLYAWEDIVAKRLYLTGSASQGEHFRDDYHLPNQTGAHVAETCVTTTWIQLNAQLLRLTGKARFGDQLERTFYNHLAAAQRPDGAQWCYFTSLEGTKPYGPGINCCVSSGPRGMALVPLQACLLMPASGGQPATLAINLLDSMNVRATIDGQRVSFEWQSDFPRSTNATLTVRPDSPARFAIAFRAPVWAQPVVARIGDREISGAQQRDGWWVLPAREWKQGDQIKVSFQLSSEIIYGTHGNEGRAALNWGPFVLAYDSSKNQAGESPSVLGLAPVPAAKVVALKSTGETPLAFEALVRSPRNPEPHPAAFVPFADAGAEGGRYQVWLRAPGSSLPQNTSLSTGAQEARSRRGNVEGSITDGDEASFVVTFDATARPEDWFAVTFDTPVTLQRVIFAHGRTFHDGGWFDASTAKPRIEVQPEQRGSWQKVGELGEYPATTATDARGLRDGQSFSAKLSTPVKAVAVRIIGKPASGDNSRQAFASCAELQVFEK